MANKPFEYRIINPLERPKSEDLNVAQGQSHYDVRQFAYEIFGHQDGFLGSSFAPVATDPTPDNNVVLTAGVAFQYGNVESAIGGIVGLNDSYQPKAVNIDTYSIPVTAAPALPGLKRYDLIQIRAPSDSERLIDSEATDIYNPSLNSFSSLTKNKTLTSSLSAFMPEYIAAGDTATAPLSYVTGNAGVYASWSSVPKPTPASGYLEVAYIRREFAQTEIASGDIEDARTLLKLPAMVGGTGAAEIGAAGSIAYSNGTELEYTRATLFGVPQTGHILVSDGTSTPNWIAPAAASSLLVSAGANTNPTWLTPGTNGQVVMSNGTSWSATSPYVYDVVEQLAPSNSFTRNAVTYGQITALSSFPINLKPGMVRVRIQPRDTTSEYSSSTDLMAVGNIDSGSGHTAYVKIVLDGPVTKTFIFSTSVGASEGSVFPFPAFEAYVPAGTYEVTVFARTTSTQCTIYVHDCALIVSQG